MKDVISDFYSSDISGFSINLVKFSKQVSIKNLYFLVVKTSKNMCLYFKKSIAMFFRLHPRACKRGTEKTMFFILIFCGVISLK